MTQVPAQPAAGAPRSAGWRGIGGSAVVLAVATFLGHALSYAFSVVLSRALGPAEFGALGALLGLSVIAAVPASALQAQTARDVALAPGRATERRSHRLGWGIGAALAAGLCVLAVPIALGLRLGGVSGVVFLAAGLVAVSAIGARQGVLLGRGAFVLLGLATVVVPGLRLVGAVVAGWAGLGAAGAVGMQAAASWAGLVAVLWLMRFLPVADAADPGGPTLRTVLGATWAMLGLFVLAGADVVLARLYLGDVESGIYAVGALGAKVVFWGSSFLALLVFPRVARGEGGRRLVLAAVGLICAVGLLGAAMAVPLADPLLAALVGRDYSAAAGLLPWFVLLGTLMALVQVLTYASVAAGERRFATLIWVALAGAAGTVVLVGPTAAGAILASFIVATALLACIGVLRVWRGVR
jgi:O-antigen/teichoic acid export membrane protein